MKRIILAAMLLATACTPPAINSASTISTLDRIEARYEKARTVGEALVALFPAYADRPHAIEARIEQALAAARLAVTIAAQQQAIRDAEAAMMTLERDTGVE